MWRQTQVDSSPGPDSHDQRMAQVRRAMHREARDRVVHAGLVPHLGCGSCWSPGPGGEIPREVRLQWFAFNAPLMWVAAANDHECAILEWLNQQTESLPPVLVNGCKVAA